jgi:hypothetical protein
LTTHNLNGQWKCHVETGNGSGDPVFTFVHAGQNLLGSYKGLFGDATVYGSLGRSDSVQFSFTARREEQEIPVTYSGKVESADKMQGKVQFGELGEGTWTATK